MCPPSRCRSAEKSAYENALRRTISTWGECGGPLNGRFSPTFPNEPAVGDDMSARTSTSTYLVRGALMGLLMGVLTWLTVVAVQIAHPADRPGLLSLGLIYLVGGIAGGAIVGVLTALTRWWLGAMVVGFAAAIPLIACVALVEDGGISRENIPAVLWVSLILGAPTGLSLRYVWRKADPFGPVGPISDS